jgi:hypothetical protein
MKAYMITTFCHDSYSYSGVEPDEHFFFLSQEKAIEHAKNNNLILVDGCVDDPDKEARLEEITIIE